MRTGRDTAPLRPLPASCAVLTYGLSSEYANQPKSAKSDKSENDRLTYNRRARR